MGIVKINKFCIYALTTLLMLSIINGYYGLVVMLENISPSYGLWFEGLLTNLIMIVLLHINRFSFIAYLYLMVSLINGFVEGGFSPIYWLHRGDMQAFIGLNLWMLELLFSVIGLGLWLVLRFYKKDGVDNAK